MPDENKVTTPENQGEMPASFEAWIEKHQRIKALYEEHISGLKTTVKTTREERDDLKNRLRRFYLKLKKAASLKRI